MQAYLAAETVSFSSQLSPSSSGCDFATDVDSSILQQAGRWTAQVFLGENEVQNSPVNVSVPSSPVSALMSYGLNAKGQQMEICDAPSACQTYFEVVSSLSYPFFADYFRD